MRRGHAGDTPAGHVHISVHNLPYLTLRMAAVAELSFISLPLEQHIIPKRTEIATGTNTQVSDNLQDPRDRPRDDQVQFSTPAIPCGAFCQAASHGNR